MGITALQMREYFNPPFCPKGVRIPTGCDIAATRCDNTITYCNIFLVNRVSTTSLTIETIFHIADYFVVISFK
jgi:hypothetical protein